MRSILWPQIVLVLSAHVAWAADYERDVRPILTGHCVRCHGPEKQESGLRVDSVARLLQGGDRGPAIVPGKSGESLLIRALTGTDELERMPAESDPLSANHVAVLKKWIDEGAKLPAGETAAATAKTDHWSFRPVVRPPLPTVKQPLVEPHPDRPLHSRPPGARTAHAQRRSRPADADPPAEPRPARPAAAPDEVDAFLGDPTPDAYERVVDRLLASPHYGERWGRHWLDLARYADSRRLHDRRPALDLEVSRLGHRRAQPRPAVRPVHDRAARRRPVAARATTDQTIATGFHRNTLINQEGGTDPEQFRVEAVVDRVNTTGAVFLGLTVGCAQCHDAQVRPASRSASTTSCSRSSTSATSRISWPRRLCRRCNSLASRANWPPRRSSSVDHEAAAAGQSSAAALDAAGPERISLRRRRDAASSSTTSRCLVTGDSPATDTYTIAAETALGGVTAVRIEALTHDSLPKRGPGLSRNR